MGWFAFELSAEKFEREYENCFSTFSFSNERVAWVFLISKPLASLLFIWNWIKKGVKIKFGKLMYLDQLVGKKCITLTAHIVLSNPSSFSVLLQIPSPLFRLVIICKDRFRFSVFEVLMYLVGFVKLQEFARGFHSIVHSVVPNYPQFILYSSIFVAEAIPKLYLFSSKL